MDTPARELSPLERACNILRRGGVVALPTDTCFGLAGDALRRDTVERVLAIKGRAFGRPPAVFVPDAKAIERVACLSPAAGAAVARLMPGPWTVLLAPHAATPPWLVSAQGLVGIRWVRFPLVARLLSSTRLLLTATSANATGLPPPYEADAVIGALSGGSVDMVLHGRCGGLPPSTVIDLTTEPPQIRRLGSSAAACEQEVP